MKHTPEERKSLRQFHKIFDKLVGAVSDRKLSEKAFIEVVDNVKKALPNALTYAQPDTGEHILHYATRIRNYMAIQVLTEQGADPSVANKKGKVPSDLMVENQNLMVGNQEQCSLGLRRHSVSVYDLPSLEALSRIRQEYSRGETYWDQQDAALSASSAEPEEQDDICITTATQRFLGFDMPKPMASYTQREDEKRDVPPTVMLPPQ